MPHLRRSVGRAAGLASRESALALVLLAAGPGALAQDPRTSAGADERPGRAVIEVSVPPGGAAAEGGSTPSSVAELEALLPAEATMVVLDTATGRHLRLRPERAARPFPPCSTFKIPNTLIALGAGAITVDDHFMARDPERDPRGDFWSAGWDSDQDLSTALRRSTVWYYQELARRVGREEMQHQLDRMDYGNRDISGPIDRFWLGGPLAISADQQVDFLRRLHGGAFAFPSEHMALLRQGLLQEEEGHALYAKTGACTVDGSERWVGWWVGWVERPAGPAFFALALTGASYREIAPRRIPLARAVLTGLGLIPATE
ncbi:MAG TPA: penicillin-binding transpeptidase domain-containing protein [Thermoanaerobaculia bacterium]|nr:penicillin-binding transpeptidase domain-containing protein [Thermoanaerobaculia bacterium]